ncbi:hypothetical protein [Acinetobacter sp. YK3]|uniref:hypothetical protein n=1 Tax=Acinetobacter sp. YK3 TaxID=1860097 RepID=UPI00084C3A04|nr:hypothetical protein [Acinetobacter sp. YK3]OEC84746.1 hypothetical protein A9Z07_13555 [Acinetobacter sp. YK3]
MVTTARLNHTSSFGGSGDERNPKEKFIDYCDSTYFASSDYYSYWRKLSKRELTEAELVEKQKCEDAINKKFTPEDYFSIGLILIPFLFFAICNMKGYLSVKKFERETGKKADMSIHMIPISAVSLVLTAFLWMILYAMYYAYLYHKYQF